LKNFILGISNICLQRNFHYALILNENTNFSRHPEENFFFFRVCQDEVYCQERQSRENENFQKA